MWYQIDNNGEWINGTLQTRQYYIKPPSDYNNKINTSGWNISKETRGTNALQANTAKTKLNLMELVLDERDTLRDQRKIIGPFMNFLKRMKSKGENSIELENSVQKILEKYIPSATSPEMLAQKEIAEIQKKH